MRAVGLLLVVLLASVLLPGCAVIGGVFKAGIGAALLALLFLAAIVALLLQLIR